MHGAYALTGIGGGTVESWCLGLNGEARKVAKALVGALRIILGQWNDRSLGIHYYVEEDDAHCREQQGKSSHGCKKQSAG